MNGMKTSCVKQDSLNGWENICGRLDVLADEVCRARLKKFVTL